jgi:phenylpyruvate tautomerase PptA (4-oxalocrotonate tautomerase family)
MPYVNVRITKGVTREQKAQLVREIDRTPKVDPRSM